MLWENSGNLTYLPIESPLRKSRYILNSLNTSPLRKILFYVFYQTNLLDISSTKFESFGYNGIYMWFNKWDKIGFAKSYVVPSMSGFVIILVFSTQLFFLVTFIRKWITFEPFELGSNARPFWNSEKECHKEILTATS